MTFPYRLIDLTHSLEGGIPTWNGCSGFHHELHLDYADCDGQDKFRVMKVQMHAGIGTHMDAPSHCVPGGKYIHELLVNDLCLSCVVIDVSSKADENYSVTTKDIRTFEDTYGLINESSCVMIKTGWERFWIDPKKYHNNHVFPSVSSDAAALLLERNVAALGIDTLSPDRPRDGFKVHQFFLGHGKILLENVAHLNKMPPTGSYVMALPLKIKNGTEAPMRLIGLVNRDR